MPNVHDECNSQVGSFTSVHAPRFKLVINKALALAMKYMAIVSTGRAGRFIAAGLGR